MICSRLGNNLRVHGRTVFIQLLLGIYQLSPLIYLLLRLGLGGLHIFHRILQGLGRTCAVVAGSIGILLGHVDLALALDLRGYVHCFILDIGLDVRRDIRRYAVAAGSLHGYRTLARLHGLHVDNAVLI